MATLSRHEGAQDARNTIPTSNRLHRQYVSRQARDSRLADRAGYVLFALLAVALLFVASPLGHWFASH